MPIDRLQALLRRAEPLAAKAELRQTVEAERIKWERTLPDGSRRYVSVMYGDDGDAGVTDHGDRYVAQYGMYKTSSGDVDLRQNGDLERMARLLQSFLVDLVEPRKLKLG